MNPGLIVKLRPAGPWRIGPDSGARNRVDAIYHSDSLYSAVAQAMSRLGLLNEWLDATARAATPAVCFSSCFPLVDGQPFIVPPRTVWPPGAASLASGRVRWKSARFVPVSMINSILAGKALDENRWTLDGSSGCLMPSGQPGPFRSSLRWSAAIDRLSGAAERHASACLEFRPGCGLWTVASFSSDAARVEWQDRVRAAFRWLADSGFGGERSRGWGRAEAPEFLEGALPEMVLGTAAPEAPVEAPSIQEPALPELPVEPSPLGEASEPSSEIALEPVSSAEPEPQPEPTPAPAVSESEPVASPAVPPSQGGAQWLLSLFSPSAEDAVEWSRGNYSLIERGGRVESPEGSGALKKQVRMVAEGSVLYSSAALRGAAPDVAPEGFAHPVFRAGFALAIALPEAS
jgi:CRISPR type III-A-associated RAMP protein Csm4